MCCFGPAIAIAVEVSSGLHGQAPQPMLVAFKFHVRSRCAVLVFHDPQGSSHEQRASVVILVVLVVDRFQVKTAAARIVPRRTARISVVSGDVASGTGAVNMSVIMVPIGRSGWMRRSALTNPRTSRRLISSPSKVSDAPSMITSCGSNDATFFF